MQQLGKRMTLHLKSVLGPSLGLRRLPIDRLKLSEPGSCDGLAYYQKTGCWKQRHVSQGFECGFKGLLFRQRNL